MHHEHKKAHGINQHKGKISYLDSAGRRAELSPEKLLDMIPIKEQDDVLDFGAGTGFFSIPVAKKVGGTVYALDIDSSMLEIIRSKAEQEHIPNIVLLRAEGNEIPLADASIDAAIASLVLHEINPLAPVLEQISRVLKSGGHLVCVELEPKGESDHKAPRISSAGMEQAIQKAGLQITRKFFPAASLYVLIAQKE